MMETYYERGSGKTNLKFTMKRLAKRIYSFWMTNIYLNSAFSLGTIVMFTRSFI